MSEAPAVASPDRKVNSFVVSVGLAMAPFLLALLSTSYCEVGLLLSTTEQLGRGLMRGEDVGATWGEQTTDFSETGTDNEAR